MFYKTGEKVFDWEIPKEWIIRDAYLEHEKGAKFAEFKKNNLHIVGYSHHVNRVYSKDELLRHTNKNHTNTKEISCDNCPAKFLSLRCLRQHTIEEHDNLVKL